MTDEPILLQATRDGVLTLTLNRPASLNSLTDPLLDAITVAVNAARDDADVRAIVITGSGRAFCSGQDLRVADDNGSIDVARHLREHYHPAIQAIRTIEKPVVAAINGVAAGAGLSLALACDLRVAADNASLVLAFVRIGLSPDAGSSFFLPRLIGMARALEMAMLGDAVDAQQALQWGLVNRVAAEGALPTEAHELAERLARGPRSIGIIKRLFNGSLDSDLTTQLTAEEEAQVEAAATEDFIEGVSAFFNKRAAAFTGS